MPKLTLQDQWDNFELAVGLVQFSQIQRQEMKRAFYAGATSILDAIMKSLSPDAEPTEEDMDYMNSLHLELVEFSNQIRQGRA